MAMRTTNAMATPGRTTPWMPVVTAALAAPMHTSATKIRPASSEPLPSRFTSGSGLAVPAFTSRDLLLVAYTKGLERKPGRNVTRRIVVVAVHQQRGVDHIVGCIDAGLPAADADGDDECLDHSGVELGTGPTPKLADRRVDRTRTTV